MDTKRQRVRFKPKGKDGSGEQEDKGGREWESSGIKIASKQEPNNSNLKQ